MKKNNGKFDTIGRWSQDKLGILKKYLEAYLKVLTKQEWCQGYEYIDAFAGTGKPKDRDALQFIDGSPRIALGLKKPFTRYHFIEESSWRVEKLRDLCKEFKDRDVSIYHEDCNKVLKGQILQQLTYASKKRAVAFIDPFGMQVDWETLKALSETKAIEVILNFPVMAINRSVLRKNPEAISQKDLERLSKLWGTKEWMEEMYEEDLTLFGPERRKKRMSGKDFGKVFRNRLSEIFPHCTDPVLMVNSKNTPLYCLMFAGHNATGSRIAGGIFKNFEAMRHL